MRTIREAVEELRWAELDSRFTPPVISAASKTDLYHFFWDNIDKLKPTDFRAEILLDLVDSLCRRKNGLIVTSSYSMNDLVGQERLYPVVVHRLGDTCRIVEV